MQKMTKFKVIFDLFTVCVYFIQQQNCKLYCIYLMIISEIQSEIGHCSCDSAKFKAPADFSHHAILCMTLSLSVCHASLSVHCSLMVTRWEKAYLLALLYMYVMFSFVFVTFPCGIQGQVWYLIVLIRII